MKIPVAEILLSYHPSTTPRTFFAQRNSLTTTPYHGILLLQDQVGLLLKVMHDNNQSCIKMLLPGMNKCLC